MPLPKQENSEPQRKEAPRTKRAVGIALPRNPDYVARNVRTRNRVGGSGASLRRGDDPPRMGAHGGDEGGMTNGCDGRAGCRRGATACRRPRGALFMMRDCPYMMTPDQVAESGHNRLTACDSFYLARDCARGPQARFQNVSLLTDLARQLSFRAHSPTLQETAETCKDVPRNANQTSSRG